MKKRLRTSSRTLWLQELLSKLIMLIICKICFLVAGPRRVELILGRIFKVELVDSECSKEYR